MKRATPFIFCFFAFCVLGVLLLNSCVEYASDSTVKILNNSSYNLRLTFIY
jgi:hypothetical protein